MGKNVIKAQYYTTSNTVSGASSIDASLMAIAWDYNFSKRTTAYVAYATTSNDDNVYYSVDWGGHGAEIVQAAGEIADAGGVVGGKDPSAFSLGVIHKF